MALESNGYGVRVLSREPTLTVVSRDRADL
jgi:hypothetical protein